VTGNEELDGATPLGCSCELRERGLVSHRGRARDIVRSARHEGRMTLPLAVHVLLCAALAACTRSTPRTAARPESDDGLASVIRVLVEDSAMAGAGRADRPVTAADPTTARLLRAAGHLTALPVRGQMLLCPSSTLADGTPPPDARGYYLRLEVVPSLREPSDSTVRVVEVTHSCRFMYQGEFSRGGVYSTTMFWEVRLRDGRWGIARRLGFSIT